jgi:hypothetical protein
MQQSQEVVCRFLFHHGKALLEETCEKGTKGRHTLFELHIRLTPSLTIKWSSPSGLHSDPECKQPFT